MTPFLAIVPVTVVSNSNTARQAPTDVPFHPKYSGTVLFQNKFHGRLSASDYPKVNVRLLIGYSGSLVH